MEHSEEIINVLNINISKYLNNTKFGEDKKQLLTKMLELIAKDIFNFKFIKEQNEYIDNLDLQELLSTLNESKISQKKEGAYFTPKDVTEFIISNSFKHFLHQEKEYGNSINDISIKLSHENLSDLDKYEILTAQVIDPTCGNGEFLLNALRLKMKIYFSTDLKAEDDLLTEIFSSFHGNDMDEISITITKIRLLFEFIDISMNNNQNVNYFELLYILTNNFVKFNFEIGRA